MGKERFKRVLIILGVILLSAWILTAFNKWRQNQQVKGESISLPVKAVTDKVEQWGGQVLGKVVESLPGSNQIKEEIISESIKPAEEEKIPEVNPNQILEKQTKEIVETLKALPEEQLAKIKKQIFGEFCREILN